jgi:hypothetical protein
MNTSDDIVFTITDSELSDAIQAALDDTCKAVHDRAYPNSDYRFYDTNKISATTRNPDVRLSFLKFFLNKPKVFNEDWVREVFNTIHHNTDSYIKKNGNAFLKKLDITPAIQPQDIAYHTLRALHVFLIALWARKAVQLTITFSLPQTTVYPGPGYEGNYKLDTAYDLYPPILKLVRKPFQHGVKEDSIPDLTPFIRPTTLTNFKSLAWRPIIASSWSTTEDIKLSELKDVFESLITRRATGSTTYGISAKAWITPLMELDPTKFEFTIGDVREILKTSFPPESQYDEKLNTPDYARQRDSWNVWTSNYLQMLVDTRKVKNPKTQTNSLSRLSYYFLSALPSHGLTPPTVEDVRRAHVDGEGKAPPLRTFFQNRAAASHASHFFDYVSRTLAAQGIQFINPLTKYDKPFERRPTITNKKTFSFNEFREFYSLGYAIIGFIEHIINQTLENDAPEEWQHALRAYSKKDAIVDTEFFGYTPIINYTDIQGQIHLIPLRHIPFKLLSIEQLPLKSSNGQKYFLLPTPDVIAAVIIALETSLRFIHIRWLDRLRVAHDYNLAGDDYLKITEMIDLQHFDLFVNTDKSGEPWVRTTSTRLLKIFHVVSHYKKHINRDHFDFQMAYTHDDLTHYPLITALFCHNKDQTVLKEGPYRAYYKQLIYFFHQIRLAHEQPQLEPIPKSVQQLKSKDDYQHAYEQKNLFKTEYTPHGIRATVISLSSTFVSDEHIGQHISGHKKQSVTRYVVINKGLVSDVSVLTGSNIISALSWSKADIPVPPKDSYDLLHSTFAIQAPNGKMLSSEEILARRHLISIFSTHFCLAGGECTEDVVNTVGRFSCGQCYLGLKSKGHLPAIIAYTRRLSADMDDLQARIKLANGSLADGVHREIEENLKFLINEFCAWTLTAEHILKNSEKLGDNFFTVADSTDSIVLAKLPNIGPIEGLLARISDAVCYPELANSSLKADIFKLSGKLMRLDSTFGSLFTVDDEQILLSEMRGRLQSFMISSGCSISQLETLLLEIPTMTSPMEKIL